MNSIQENKNEIDTRNVKNENTAITSSTNKNSISNQKNLPIPQNQQSPQKLQIKNVPQNKIKNAPEVIKKNTYNPPSSNQVNPLELNTNNKSYNRSSSTGQTSPNKNSIKDPNVYSNIDLFNMGKNDSGSYLIYFL
jgi:hypothetical protein